MHQLIRYNGVRPLRVDDCHRGQIVSWLDASDLSTLTLASGAVSAQIGPRNNGLSSSQGTAGSRFTYAAAGRNGLPSVQADGSADHLVIDSPSQLPTGDVHYTICTQAYNNENTGFGFWWGQGETGNAGRYLGNGHSTGGGPNIFYSNIFGDQDTTTTWYLNDRTVVAHLSASDALTIHADGTSIVSGTFTSGGATAEDAYIGAMPFSGPINHATGDLQEQFVLKNVDANIEHIDRWGGYLAWKWARTSALPATHAFKHRQPVVAAGC